MIYFDNAASTPIDDNVRESIIDCLSLYGNPSSVHEAGIMANDIIEKTKIKISKYLNCLPEEIYFTSGATMSNSCAVLGTADVLITSSIEHNDIIEMAESFDEHYTVGIDRTTGLIKEDELCDLLNYLDTENKICVVSIQCANSESGVIQNIERITSIVHTYKNCILHTDATQYIPYYPIDVKQMGIDMLSMSGQKINCIKGIGILYVKKNIPIKKVIYGEQGLVGGTPAVPLIAGLGTAFDNLSENILFSKRQIESMRDYILDELMKIGFHLVGTKSNRLYNNIYGYFDGIDGLNLVYLLNDYGICIGTGSACSTISTTPSHVAMAYLQNEQKANECIRITLGKQNTWEEVDKFINITKGLIKTLL